MKVEDIQIGDWVQNPLGASYQVLAIHFYKINKDGDGYYGIHLKNKGAEASLAIYDLHPIPLTPEILEKNGFATEDGAHYQIQDRALELLWQEIPFGKYQCDMVRTEHTKNKNGQDCFIDYYIATIDYVHQLQHTLRFLGIKKEIVL